MPRNRGDYFAKRYANKRLEWQEMVEELDRLRNHKVVDHQACDAEIVRLKKELHTALMLVEQYKRKETVQW